MGGAAGGVVVGIPGLDFGRLSAVTGSARFFGFGFSDGGRGAGLDANKALPLAFPAFSRRFRLRLSSRSFSRTGCSVKNRTLRCTPHSLLWGQKRTNVGGPGTLQIEESFSEVQDSSMWCHLIAHYKRLMSESKRNRWCHDRTLES